jgi:hypothetical protein
MLLTFQLGMGEVVVVVLAITVAMLLARRVFSSPRNAARDAKLQQLERRMAELELRRRKKDS